MTKGIGAYVGILLSIIIMILCFEFFMVLTEKFSLKYSYVLLLMFLSVLLVYRNKVTWLIMLGVCVYGVFNIIRYGSTVAFATSMDFTANLNHFIFSGASHQVFKRMLGLFPLFFYLLVFVTFLIRPLRKYYNAKFS